MHAPVVTYQVDSQGRIVSLGPGWDRFARANHGDHLVGSAITGRVLWDFISDPTTRALYRAMAERLIDGLPEIAFTFRCDAPEARRLLGMRMLPLADDGIEFQVTPVNEAARPRVAILDPTVARSGELLRMCSWCSRVPAATDEWIEVEAAVQRLGWSEIEKLPGITHGICPACETRVFGLVNGSGPPVDRPAEFGAFA